MGNAKSMSSITSSSSREQVSTTTTTTTTTATKTIRPMNIHIPFKPAVMMSTINSSRKFYLNLSELKSGSSNSGDQSTKLVSSSSFEPSPTSSYTDEEYTSLNEIIESIESFPNMTTTVRVDDNYANLDFKDENNNNKSSFFGDKPSNRFSTLFSQPIPKELDSQLYSNVRLISCDKLSGGCERPKRRRAKLNQQQSSTLTECHKRISINLASLHLLTANLLSKLSKNVQKRQENASQQQSTKKCDNTETKKTSSTTKQSQNDLVILIPPPQKAFNPFHELDNTRKEEEEETAKKTKINDDEHQSTSASNSFSNSSPSPSDLDDLVAEEIIDDDDEGFYQTLNSSSHHRNDYDNEIKPLNNINSNNKYNELSDYDYLVSYEWPRTLPETTTTIPPPLPASSQPNRTQAILKFFEYN